MAMFSFGSPEQNYKLQGILQDSYPAPYGIRSQVSVQGILDQDYSRNLSVGDYAQVRVSHPALGPYSFADYAPITPEILNRFMEPLVRDLLAEGNEPQLADALRRNAPAFNGAAADIDQVIDVDRSTTLSVGDLVYVDRDATSDGSNVIRVTPAIARDATGLA